MFSAALAVGFALFIQMSAKLLIAWAISKLFDKSEQKEIRTLVIRKPWFSKINLKE